MRHLFSPAGAVALAAVLARRPLLAFDFDGTLAPIVERPDDARVPEAVAIRLAALAETHPVAIISGRDVDDVRTRLGFAPRWIVGNHGAEADAPDAPALAAAAEALATWRAFLDEATLAAAGVTVEHKRLSTALHYRAARDERAALAQIAGSTAQLPRTLETFGGKCVLNVVPRGVPDKADALRRLVDECGAGAALFAGDDVNDEPVFERAPSHWLTVRVGLDPASRAMFRLDGPHELAAMLDRIRLHAD